MRIVHRYLEEAFLEYRGKELWFVGSFPSVLIKEAFGRIKREKDVNYFYGSDHNRFWPILASLLFERDLLSFEALSWGWENPVAVQQRQEILQKLGMGITDVYAEIESAGKTSDKDIVPVRWNPHLEEILSSAQRIFATSQYVTHSLLSWRKGHAMGESFFPQIVTLPSPSPLSRRVGYTNEKLRQIYHKELSPYLSCLRE
ncbi:MAG: hypothetical protein N2314_04485 [Brevinematales bacterium]|nr:hypothetical protein [Brevinematales bacterium]